MVITAILDRALNGQEITPEEGVILLEQNNSAIVEDIRIAADQLRFNLVGDRVSYVVNRNINYTNICEQHCSFCAFRRDLGESGAFWLDEVTILDKVKEAVNFGATEICMQGGLNIYAKINGQSLPYYCHLIEQIKEVFPTIHIHAFSPQEIQFIAREDNLSYHQVISELIIAGLDSIPGTAAEILDDRIRRIICPEKIDSLTWLTILKTAHQLGLYTTSTILSGHIETTTDQINHLEQLRLLQKEAIEGNYPAKITEFIILPFVGESVPAPLRNRVGRDQPDLSQTLLLTAVARLYLGKYIINHQPSWVKLGINGAKKALNWGCNDLGGTLMEEHITTMAGAKGGTAMTIENLQKAIASVGRLSYQRNTLYQAME